MAEPPGSWRVHSGCTKWNEWTRRRCHRIRGRKYRVRLQKPEMDSCDRLKGLQGVVYAYLPDGWRYPVWLIVDGCHQAWRTPPTLLSLWSNKMVRIEQAPTS